MKNIRFFQGSTQTVKISLLLLVLIFSLLASVAPKASAAPAPTYDLVYSSVAPTSDTLDVWPSALANSPLVVLVHGGSWQHMDKTGLNTQAQYLQSQNFTVFNINYRLATTTNSAFPMEISDVKAATRYAIAHAALYNADPNRVTMIGGSAGGHLVNIAAQQLNAISPIVKPVKNVVALSPITNFVGLAKDNANGTLAPLIADASEVALGCSLSTCSLTTLKEWSPAWNVTSSDCPHNTLIFNGTNELIPYDQPTSMTNQLTLYGCGAQKDILPTQLHGFSYWDSVKTIVVSFIKTKT